LSWPDILLRLACAFIAGALIGLDRGEHAHPAGLRTTILIAVAAAVAMVEANWLIVHMPDTHVSIVRLDMMRLPLGILSGVGFIGAGAILRRGEIVRGVTTAATIWGDCHRSVFRWRSDRPGSRRRRHRVGDAMDHKIRGRRNRHRPARHDRRQLFRRGPASGGFAPPSGGTWLHPALAAR
jgi:hypothetical protein